MKPGPFTTKTVTELFIKGTAPSESTTSTARSTSTARAGLLWQEGCVGPRKTVGALDFGSAEEIGKWGQYNRGWQKRAARGPVSAAAGRDPDVVLLRQRLLPVREKLGRHLRADRSVPDPASPSRRSCAGSCVPAAVPERQPPGPPDPNRGKTPERP